MKWFTGEDPTPRASQMRAKLHQTSQQNRTDKIFCLICLQLQSPQPQLAGFVPLTLPVTDHSCISSRDGGLRMWCCSVAQYAGTKSAELSWSFFEGSCAAKAHQEGCVGGKVQVVVSCIKLSKFSKQLGIFTGSPRTLGSCF